MVIPSKGHSMTVGIVTLTPPMQLSNMLSTAGVTNGKVLGAAVF